MKLLKTFTTSLFVSLSVIAFAEAPTHPNTPTLTPDTIMFQSEALTSQGSSEDLEKYGIKVPFYKKLQWGAIIGFNETSNGYSNTDKPSLLSNPEFGPVFGPTLAVPFGRALGVRIELLYSQNVFSGQGEVDQTPYLYLNKLTYIDVPLEIQIKPIRKFSIFVGGDYSLLIGNTYKYVQSPINSTITQTCQNSNTRNSILGFVFGADFTLYNVTLGGRVTCGVPDNNSVNPQNVVIAQLTLGYTFQFE